MAATSLLQSASQRAALTSHAASMPMGSEEAAVNVVILAGSFNRPLVGEIQARSTNNTLQPDSSVTMLRGLMGLEHRVPAGLIAAGTTGHALEETIKHLYQAHQCNPMEQSVWLVCNDRDRAEYGGPAGFFDDCGRFPREWQDEHVLSNGCQRSADWGGHVCDLKRALEAISAAGNGHLDTLVIDANLFFWPKFNFQKLVSNMIIRKHNCIALQQLTDTDIQLYDPAGYTAPTELLSTGQVPQVAALQANVPLQSGDLATLNVAYLRADSADAVHVSKTDTLPQLIQELSHSGPIYGALVPWGIFDLSQLLPVRYIAAYSAYSRGTADLISAFEKRPAADKDCITALLQERDDVGLGMSCMMDASVMINFLGEQMADKHKEFDEHFFASEKRNFKGYQLPAYRLPPTFYMTSYRSQVADSTI